MTRATPGVLPAALGATFLVLVAFTSAITTAADTASSFGTGIAWQTWILSSMSLGLAGALMSYLPLFAQRVMDVSVLGSAVLLTVWSGTSAWVAVETRRLPARLDGRHRLIAGALVCATGLVGLAFVSTDSSWAVLVPGMVVVGVGSGLMNAALGRLAVEAVPPERAGMSSGATNTARYLGGAAGVALTIAVATGGGTSPRDLVAGWNTAALVAAGFVTLGAVVAFAGDR